MISEGRKFVLFTCVITLCSLIGRNPLPLKSHYKYTSDGLSALVIFMQLIKSVQFLQSFKECIMEN